MRMRRTVWKRYVAFILAVVMIFSLGTMTSAANISFEDVTVNDWYYDAIMDVTEMGLFSGVDSNHFAPQNSLTRGMFVAVMWRYDGKTSGCANEFNDVYKTDYYYDAVSWACTKGIVYGMSDTIFAPNNDITREQMAVIMHRYAGYLGIEIDKSNSLNEYKDSSKVSSYAVGAMKWATENEFLLAENEMIRPLDATTRAEAAVFWSEFIKEYTNSEKTENGKSAYELAVENGYKGTVQEWLASLVGVKGEDGTDGLSAYEIAVKNGYKGTEEEWLASLAGVNGLSAYEIAVKNGYKGTEIEWLASLVGEAGAAGADGKSAYELAVELGYKGSEEAWLLTLVGKDGVAGKDGEDGKDGVDGKSAYELAVENGFEGSLVEWLDSLTIEISDGDTTGKDGKSAYELAVENGFKGSVTEWLASLVGANGKDGVAGKDGTDGKDGIDGKSAYELAVEKGYKGTVQEWLASLVGSDGKNGTNGKDGADGKDGVDGKSAYEIAVENGYKGTEKEWLVSLAGSDGKNGTNGKDGAAGEDGTNGKSAYEIAVENGFKGSEKEWLESLKGTDGKNGTNGNDGVGIKTAYINEEKHLILEMTDGTIIDAGYVGVAQEEEPEIYYTVKFVDYDGREISSQQVLKGENATAPVNPVRSDYVFTGWDKVYTNVMSNLTITALYEKASSNMYTVTFVDYNGTVLSSQKVNEGSSASLPASPSKVGVDFMGWSGNYVNVIQNETVRAVYSDEKNVFIVESASGSVGDTVTILVAVDGSVKTCGFRFDLFYDSALELVSYDNDLDLDIIVNDALHTNSINLNFSSASDKTKQRDIIELTFKINNTTKKALPITVEMTEVFEVTSSGAIENSPYVVVNGVVKVGG